MNESIKYNIILDVNYYKGVVHLTGLENIVFVKAD